MTTELNCRHKNRIHYAFGLCRSCYSLQRWYYLKKNKPEVIEKYNNSRRNGSAFYEKRWGKLLMEKYKITIEEYWKRFKKQGGVCAICGIPPIAAKLAVDHNHATGEIRGLLCKRCNSGIAAFNDNLESLTNAIKYLRHKKENTPQQIPCGECIPCTEEELDYCVRNGTLPKRVYHNPPQSQQDVGQSITDAPFSSKYWTSSYLSKPSYPLMADPITSQPAVKPDPDSDPTGYKR